jgi:hypothetical protein
MGWFEGGLVSEWKYLPWKNMLGNSLSNVRGQIPNKVIDCLLMWRISPSGCWSMVVKLHVVWWSSNSNLAAVYYVLLSRGIPYSTNSMNWDRQWYYSISCKLKLGGHDDRFCWRKAVVAHACLKMFLVDMGIPAQGAAESTCNSKVQ